jgi:muramoyltetrapeptide carboxypeptidase LdcA involved in peptidoglycan recycling
LKKEPGRGPAKVTRLLALAHRIARSNEAGEIRDQAEAARLLGLTRARVSKLLDLTLLAPDIQEHLLFLEDGTGVVEQTERTLRPLTRTAAWQEQRTLL